MSTHQPASSLFSSLPSPLEDCHLRPESIALESEACSTFDNPFANAHRISSLSFGTTLPGTPCDEKSKSKLWEKPRKDYANRIEELGDLNTQIDEKPDFVDPDGMKEHRAKKVMKVRKFAFQCTIFGLKYVRSRSSLFSLD